MSRKASSAQIDIKFEIVKIDMNDLVPHEGVIEEHIQEVYNEMKRDDFQLRPIAISQTGFSGRQVEREVLDSRRPPSDGRSKTAKVHENHGIDF